MNSGKYPKSELRDEPVPTFSFVVREVQIQKGVTEMATKKISYPYSIMAHDVNDALDRLNRFVKRQLNTEVDSVKVFWNGGAYVGFRFFIGKKEYYWIPSNYDGCYRIEGNSDVLGFVQKLHDTQHREFEPRWWILSVGNSGKKSIEKVCTTILELYKGEA